MVNRIDLPPQVMLVQLFWNSGLINHTLVINLRMKAYRIVMNNPNLLHTKSGFLILVRSLCWMMYRSYTAQEWF
jgi:hypothetical protein